MTVAQLARGEPDRVARASEVDDVLAGARSFIRAQVLDPALQHLVIHAIAGLHDQLADEEKALFPFVHFPLGIYSAIRGETAPARSLAIATTLLFLGIDILDDIADHDLPGHWEGVKESEIQLVAATLLASLPQLAISQLPIQAASKVNMLHCLSEGLLRMSGGQLHDLRGAGSPSPLPEAVEKSVAHKSGEEGALIARLSAHMAGVSDDMAQKFGDFGRVLATGGQIATDCHDIFQAAQSKDFANGSRTLPIALYLSRLEGTPRAAFLAQLDEARENLAVRTMVQNELRAKGVLRLCALIVEMYCQKAQDSVASLGLSNNAAQNLERMIAHVSFFSNKEGL